MKIVILGCGRVGARVANFLTGSHDLTVVDWNESGFDRLNPDFEGRTVLGNGIDVDVLRSAGVGDADLFFALTDGDNRNLMAAQIGKYLGASKVVARVYDPVRCDAFAKFGLITVSPTVNGARRLFEMLTGEIGES
jgi:trk system potassium uptake protein TrkA